MFSSSIIVPDKFDLIILLLPEMGGSSSTPVPSDAGGSAAIVTQAPTGGCPVQHSSPAPDRTSKPSISECPVHQDSMVKLQASQCPISAGTGCDSAAIDKGADALDPANMVKVIILLLVLPLKEFFSFFSTLHFIILMSVFRIWCGMYVKIISQIQYFFLNSLQLSTSQFIKYCKGETGWLDN